MVCIDEGQLRAYLDDELTPAHQAEVARHLTACPACDTQLATLRQTAAAVTTTLATWLPEQEMTATAAEPRAALSRFAARRQLLAQERTRASTATMTKGQRYFAPARRPVLAALSLAVILALVISFAPLQSLADNLFHTFRVQQFAAVTVPIPGMTALPQPQSLTDEQKSQIAGMLQSLGTPVNLPAKENFREVASVDQARAHLAANGVALRALPADKVPSGISGVRYGVSDPLAPQLVLNAQVARQYATMANQPDAAKLIPDVQTLTFGLDVPAAVAMIYGDQTRGFGVVQLASPTLKIPAEVDVAAIRMLLLGMPGLDLDTANRIKSIDKWDQTLIIPVPQDAKTRDIKVNGNPGIVIVDGQGRGTLVLWSAKTRNSVSGQDEPVLYAVGGTLTETEALDIAAGLK